MGINLIIKIYSIENVQIEKLIYFSNLQIIYRCVANLISLIYILNITLYLADIYNLEIYISVAKNISIIEIINQDL